METNVQTVTECNAKVMIREPIPTMAIHSVGVAEALVVDRPHFLDLLDIQKDKNDPRKRVWLFRKTPEMFQSFLEIVEERKQARENREQLDSE